MTRTDSAAEIISLHRYPVKSLLGEELSELVDARGVVGDRGWSVRTETGKIGSGKNTRRFASVPGLLQLRSRHDGDRPVVVFPDGTSTPVDSSEAAARVSSVVGSAVTLAKETSLSHFDDGPVSLIGTASLAAVSHEVRSEVSSERFRANIVVRTSVPFVEEQWIGGTVRLGSALLAVEMESPRCVMLDAATVDMPAAPGLLPAVGAANHGRLGVIGRVVAPGRIAMGNAVVAE
jgi:uncharacterized protein YcbX